MDQASQVAVGTVVKAHGIRGELKVALYSGSADAFRSYRELLLAPAEGGDGARSFAVRRARPQDGAVLLELEGIETRNQAEALVGWKVLVERGLFAELAEHEYYWHDLVGFTVRTVDGTEIGTVQGLLATPGHDLLVVADGTTEYLVPMRREIVVHEDRATGELVIDPPEGLLDLNRAD